MNLTEENRGFLFSLEGKGAEMIGIADGDIRH